MRDGTAQHPGVHLGALIFVIYDDINLLQKRPGVQVFDLDAERSAGKAAGGAPVDLIPDGRFAGVLVQQICFLRDLRR